VATGVAGVAAGVVGRAAGACAVFPVFAFTPLFQTNFFPFLIQVNFFPWESAVIPSFLQVRPGLGEAAFAGLEKIRARINTGAKYLHRLIG
jgi:hypothetical protein